MEKIVYIKVGLKRENFGKRYICVHKDFKQDVINLFSDFKYEITIEDFYDSHVRLINKGVSYNKFWNEALKLLKDNGFAFATSVENEYEEIQRQLKHEEQKRIEQEELERQRLELAKIEYKLVCPKYGCTTNIGFCINKCKYNTLYNMNCRPERVEIKKEGI